MVYNQVMTKILLTGGAGFIGSNLTRKLLELGNKVICLDNFDENYSPKIKERNIKPFLNNKNYKFYQKDILDFDGLKEIFTKEEPEKICHLAAKAGVRQSILTPKIYEEVNVGGTLNLLELAKNFRIENFVYASSSSVYGNLQKVPFSENDKTDTPLSPYAASKKAAEMFVSCYHHLYKLNCTILRFFTVYGPSGRPDMAPFLFTDEIFKGRPIKKFGDGTSKRDYTYVDDVVEGIISALNKNLSFEIINLGNNKPVFLNDFITLIEEKLGKKAVIENYPQQPGDVEITFADISKAQKLLGYNPKIKIEEGMGKFIDWYLKNWQLYVLHTRRV